MSELREPPPPSSRGPSTAAAVLGGLLAVAGLVWLLAAVDAVPVSAQVAVGALLVLIGLALALLPGGGHAALLVAAGIALALVGASVSALNLHLVDGSVGERRYAPADLTDVRHEYSLGIGSLGVDLTRLELEGEENEGALPVRATIGIGELVVAVPREAFVTVDARVAVGEIEVRGRRHSGFDVRLQMDDGDAAAPAFRLQLEGGIGAVRVVDDDLGDFGENR
jgi:hypothetical protein